MYPLEDHIWAEEDCPGSGVSALSNDGENCHPSSQAEKPQKRQFRPGRREIARLYGAMCHFCGKSFPDVESKNDHASTHYDRLDDALFRCNTCFEKMYPLKELYRHLTKRHTGYGFHCLIKRCAKAFTDKRLVIEHHYKHHHYDEYSVIPRKLKLSDSESDTLEFNNNYDPSAKLCEKSVVDVSRAPARPNVPCGMDPFVVIERLSDTRTKYYLDKLKWSAPTAGTRGHIRGKQTVGSQCQKYGMPDWKSRIKLKYRSQKSNKTNSHKTLPTCAQQQPRKRGRPRNNVLTRSVIENPSTEYIHAHIDCDDAPHHDYMYMYPPADELCSPLPASVLAAASPSTLPQHQDTEVPVLAVLMSTDFIDSLPRCDVPLPGRCGYLTAEALDAAMRQTSVVSTVEELAHHVLGSPMRSGEPDEIEWQMSYECESPPSEQRVTPSSRAPIFDVGRDNGHDYSATGCLSE